MRVVLIAMLLLFTGCRLRYLGDAAIPTVCSTQLPGTRYSIYLHGPHDGGYSYAIETPDGNCGIRWLGAVTIDESIPPRLDNLGAGVFRVTWGKAPDTVFTTIDTAQRLIVADSNKSNPGNHPFETPR